MAEPSGWRWWNVLDIRWAEGEGACARFRSRCCVWGLENFLSRFDEWVAEQDPTDDQRRSVLVWVQTLMTEPYHGASPHPDVGLPLWFAFVPDTQVDDHRVVCEYRVDEKRHTLVCNRFGTLREPII